jgi:hypothetical protein
MNGNFDEAIRLIELRLQKDNVPNALRCCLIAQREIMRRLPSEYPYTRAEALAIVSDPSLSVGEALAVLLFYSHAAQELLDWGVKTELSRDAALETARQFAEAGDFPGLVAFYENLEILTDRWRELLETGGVKRPWQEEDRRFARYLVERYWLQAISDFDIVSRAKLVVISCIMVRHLGGDPVETAQIYSKEIENNSENVETLLEWAFKARSMTDRNLLGLLLN